jgi:hypothetical protein
MCVRNRRWTVAVAALVIIGSLGASMAGTGASPPTDDPALAAEYGAGWLAAQIAPDGSLPGGFDPLGDAGSAALALGTSGVAGDAFDRAVGYVRDNIDDFVAYPFDPTIDDPGRLGKAVMLAEQAGEDPSTFGGTDLVARLQATLGLFEPGLYGAADPSFDGVFRQGLAVTGLLAAGVDPPDVAFDWLGDQQCTAPPAAAGAWEDYRADTTVDCDAPDPNTFAGPDTNSTALAIMALEAADEVYPSPAAFLAANQNADGGWPFIPGLGSDPSSTSLIIRALVSMGEDPDDWPTSGGDPWSSLLSWQQGCDSPAADQGAFTSAFADPPGTPDVFSTVDGVAGATGLPYPLDGPSSLTPGAPLVDCTPDGPNPPADPNEPTGPAAGVTPSVTPARAVTTDPAFTG